jgi:hypothetical protein
MSYDPPGGIPGDYLESDVHDQIGDIQGGADDPDQPGPTAGHDTPGRHMVEGGETAGLRRLGEGVRTRWERDMLRGLLGERADFYRSSYPTTIRTAHSTPADMTEVEVVLVGGPSDGMRIMVNPSAEYVRVMDPMTTPTVHNPPMSEFHTWAGDSTYVRTTLNFNDFQITVYAHSGLNIIDAWLRLVQRYPRQDQREITNCIR